MKRPLAEKSIIPLVGPSAVGKTTLMKALEQANPAYKRVISFTTRAQRPGEAEDTYRFLDQDPRFKYAKNKQEHIKCCINKWYAMGQLVQYAEHPKTSDIYGTTVADYRGKYNLLDTLSGAVEKFRHLGFLACRPIMIVASPADWQQRFGARNFSDDEAYKRLSEGIMSLQWGLEEEHEVDWVINKEGKLKETIKQITQVAEEEVSSLENSRKGRLMGGKLLDHLIELEDSYE